MCSSEQYVTVEQMVHFSTREAAKKLGVSHTTLARYIETGKVPTPKTAVTSNTVVHLWTQEEIENVRKLLPKIANGRKTRYLKSKKSEVRSQKSVAPKTKKKPIEKKKSVGPKAKPKTKKQPQPRAVTTATPRAALQTRKEKR